MHIYVYMYRYGININLMTQSNNRHGRILIRTSIRVYPHKNMLDSYILYFLIKKSGNLAFLGWWYNLARSRTIYHGCS